MVPVKPLQLSLMIARKARACLSEAPFMCSTLVYSPGLSHKYLTMLERPARDKHSYLLQTLLNYGRKMFYSNGPWRKVCWWWLIQWLVDKMVSWQKDYLMKKPGSNISNLVAFNKLDSKIKEYWNFEASTAFLLLIGFIEGAWSFHQSVISSIGHFIKLSFHHLVISSIGHFINRSFRELVISSIGHFVNLSFHQSVISSIGYLIKLSFHQIIISSNYHFINLSFH
jgi:hypothetical protein